MTIRGRSADGVPATGATQPEPEDLDAPSAADPDPEARGLRVLPPVPDQPPADMRYRRAFKLRQATAALWRSRSIIYSLTVRDLRATYSQEVLGFAWAILAPITLMVVFTFLANRFNGKIDTGGIWYPIFLYVGLLPWTFFSSSVSSGGTSLIGNALLNKVYAPREVFPISDIIGSIVNTLCASIALAVLFVLDGSMPSATFYWMVPLILILLVFTTGVTLLVAGLTVYLRDMRHALPLALQLGLFLTPILYGLNKIPSEYRDVYAAVNPLAAIIDGTRRCLLYDQAPRASYTLIAAAVSCVWLVGSFMIFKRLETGFADVS
jgi:ABC-2 type transport system permease protein/lipopolysaccharide transport system permease protein